MVTSPGWREIVLANALVLVGIATFSTGFFPYKPLVPGLATFEEAHSDVAPIFDKVIFMVVDALRSDFVYSYDSGFLFTQSLIRDGAGLPFTAHASSPTVTMPRLKAMTTGSVPSFLDVILNIAESDTTSSLTYQDTWLAQLKARGDRLVMYGDDTWLKLFPGMFDRADGTTSFFVSDFVEVDQNVTRHIPDELAKNDWSALIMHYLGLDHIGHKAGPRSSFMLPKQQEMDDVVKTIYSAIQEESHLHSTLLVLCGDHGMNDAGNHGGSSAGETSPALLFISPKFKALDQKLESPTAPFGDFQYYKTVQQADITSTLAGLLGLPIPLNSLGVFIPDFLDLWDSGPRKLSVLYRNAQQLLLTVKSTFPGVVFDQETMPSCSASSNSGIEGAKCTWSEINQLLRENATDDAFLTVGPSLERFSRIAQDIMSSAATNYDTSRLGLGLLITGIAALIVMPIVYRDGALFPYPYGFLTFLVIAHGSIMFASSYVEEEQQFWYWICSGWIFYLHAKSASLKTWSRPIAGLQVNLITMSAFGLLCCQRLLRRWNQTGQKFTGESDIARSFLPENPRLLWTLVILTYVDAGRGLLMSLPPSRLPRIGAFVLPVLAFLFKLNFVANDSPELLTNSLLSQPLNAWPEAFPLVSQARIVFGGVACYMILATLGGGKLEPQNRPKRLFHEALHIFLITQSRVTNIPMFLLFRIQAFILHRIDLSGVEVTITMLIMQYLTFFAFGGSNSISSVDLSSAYNGVGSYSVVMVGVLTFVSNWIGPIWWISASQLLQSQRELKHDRPAALLTFHTASSLVFVMAACTALRAHLFIWTVFSPKYLYSMAWAIANHVAINLFGGIGLPALRKRVLDAPS